MKKKMAIKAAGMITACAVLVSAVTAGAPTELHATAANASGASKSETVYVNADASGSVKSVTVSDWLHSETSGATINDFSNLSDIRNVKGNEKPAVSGSNVTWQLDGNDLYYQGKSSKDLPVEVNIQYYLDGKETAPADMAGKSGKIEIKISFKNLDGHSVNINGAMHTVYTPFICAAAFNLPGKYFSNVTTNFGKVVSDGSNQAVSFVTVPGLKDSLYMYDTSSVNIPDTLDVTADAKDFRLSNIMMLVSPMPDMSSLGSSINVSDLTSKLGQLYDAGSQLKDATSTLNSGEQAFANGVAQLYAGLATAGTSFNEAADGAAALSYNTSSLNQLISGANDLYNGASALSGGLDQTVAGLPALTNGAKSADDGASQLLGGLNQLKSDSSQGAADYANYADSTVYGVISAGLSTLKGTIYSAVKKENPTADAATLASLTATEYGQAVNGELATLHAAADSQLASTNPDITQATEYVNMYDALNIIAYDQDVTGESDSSIALNAFVAAMKEDPKTKYADYMYKFESTSVLSDLNNSNIVLSGPKFQEKLIKHGIEPLITGATQLEGGTAQLKAATAANGSLVTGLGQLDLGGKNLMSGAYALKQGTSKLTELKAGIDKLAQGLGMFNTQALAPLTSGASALNGNASLLTSGTSQLSAGMGKFFDEGLSKLNGADKTNLSDALAVKDEMIKLSDSYTSFSGTPDGVTTSVKFIVKTDEIKPSATVAANNAKSSKKSTAHRNFFQRIADFFTKR